MRVSVIDDDNDRYDPDLRAIDTKEVGSRATSRVKYSLTLLLDDHDRSAPWICKGESVYVVVSPDDRVRYRAVGGDFEPPDPVNSASVKAKCTLVMDPQTVVVTTGAYAMGSTMAELLGEYSSS